MKQGPWLNGWNDLVANLEVLPQCLRLVDIQGNGSNNLIVAEKSGRLICYKNTNIEWETKSAYTPISLTYFYSEQQTNPPQPYLAVASGSSVYVYKFFRAFYQFKLPLVSMNQQEEALWTSYTPEGLDTLIAELSQLSSQIQLSYKGQEMLCYIDKAKQLELANQYSESTKLEDIITCLDVLKKIGDEEMAPGQVVIGTELKNLYILNNDLIEVHKKFTLPGTPIAIQCFADDQPQGRIAVLVRENKVYFVGNDVEKYTVDLASKPIHMVRQNKSLFIATMDRMVQCYKQQSKQYQIQFQDNILTIENLEYGKGKSYKALLVALDNQTIQFFQETQLLSTINLECNVAAMKFGQFGREDGFLVIINTKGGINTKILQRQFQKSILQSQAQDLVPINIPKKTKIYIEQVKRERDQGTEILKAYQNDLLRMRLKTAQTYINILSNDLLAPQLSQTSNFRFQGQVEGLGPLFKMVCQVENIGSQVNTVQIGYEFNQNIYEIIEPKLQLTYLIPANPKQFTYYLKNIHEKGISEPIKMHLFKDKQVIISVVIQMPMSEL